MTVSAITCDVIEMQRCIAVPPGRRYCFNGAKQTLLPTACWLPKRRDFGTSRNAQLEALSYSARVRMGKDRAP